MVPRIMIPPAYRGQPPKVANVKRAKALAVTHPDYNFLNLVVPEALRNLENNYLSLFANQIDSTSELTQAALKELNAIKAIDDYDEGDEILAPSNYQYNDYFLESELQKANTPLNRLKLISKVQNRSSLMIQSYANYIFLFGIKELGRTGLLNDDKLPPVLNAPKVEIADKRVGTWRDKRYSESKGQIEILYDLQKLYISLIATSKINGLTIDAQTKLILMLAPKHKALLEVCKTEIKNRYPNITIMECVELTDNKQVNIALIALQSSEGAPCFISNNQCFTLNPFESTTEPDDIPKYAWSITGMSPSIKVINPALIARMKGI